MPGSDLDPTPSARLRSTSAWPSPAPRKRPAKVWILESLTPLPHMDSRSPAFTALRKYNTSHTTTPHATLLFCRFCLVAARSNRVHSHRARLVLILDFGFVFWAARAAARRNDPIYLLSAAHVNQKSFDMTTPNDMSRRCKRLVLRAAFARRANDDRVRRANSNRNRENKCWLANHVAAANGSPQ